MGLDIYFERTNKHEWKTSKDKNDLEFTQVGYFRKVNCLLPFFGYEDNCEYIAVEEYQMKELVKVAKALLKEHHAMNSSILSYKEMLEVYKDNKEQTKEIQEKMDALWENFAKIAHANLPTTAGFFFGSTKYNEWYVNDLTEIVNVFEEILDSTDFEIDQIVMYCWW